MIRSMRQRGIALIIVLLMTSLLLMMVMALYLSSRGGLFASMTQQRNLSALYVAEAGWRMRWTRWRPPISPSPPGC